MSGDISEKSCCVFDPGYNISLARRLAREFGRVDFFAGWKDSDPETLKLAIGTGFPEINRVRHFSDAISRNDIFIFPNIYHGDLQRDLINRGKRVWGSRKAERLEYDRPFFYKTLEKVGLPVPEYHVLQGLDELEEFLQENEGWWVKLNLRGDDETWKHETWELTEPKFRSMRQRYGPVGKFITFTLVKHIDSIIEAAYDGFMVASPTGLPQFPKIGFLGYEDKDLSHIVHAIPYDDFADPVREVNDLFAPVAASYFMRSGFGTEIKIAEDEETKEQINYFLDFTARQPEPPGAIIMEQVTNLGAFFWHGSEGELIPLEIEEEFGVQIIMYAEPSRSNVVPLLYPKELDQWVKPSRCCMIDGTVNILPDLLLRPRSESTAPIGSVVALGDSIEGAIDKIKGYLDEIKCSGLDAEVESLAEVLKRIQKGEEEEIPFADEVPAPEVVTNGE
jgi:hypothetical protein